jgi:DNA-binding transcriptional regulator YiaG/tetratricopeptide (TPR) repeat protein
MLSWPDARAHFWFVIAALLSAKCQTDLMPGNTEPGPARQDTEPPPTVQRWSGHDARLLREAMRMSLRDFAARLGVNERVVSKWEAGGTSVHPRPVNQQILDTTLAQADHSIQQRFRCFTGQAGASVAQVTSRSPAGPAGPGEPLNARPPEVLSVANPEVGPAITTNSVYHQVTMGLCLDEETPPSQELFAAAEAVRREVEDTLARGTISPARLDRLEELVANHIRVYTTTPPAHALANLLNDFADVQRLAVQRQPAMIQARLSEISALLATLAADSLMKLGQIPHARAWYGTAQIAADDSANTELRARVRAQHAMLPYYYGHASEAVRLGREAQEILGRTPRAAGALAAAAEARALARLGSEPEARRALQLAHDLVEQTSTSGTRESDNAFVFGTRRLLFYASSTMTNLGDVGAAQRFQQQALEHYGDKPGLIDPALIQLDHVQLLATEGDLAVNVVSSVPAAQRTLIFAARLRQIALTIPREHQMFRMIKSVLSQLANPDTRGS